MYNYNENKWLGECVYVHKIIYYFVGWNNNYTLFTAAHSIATEVKQQIEDFKPIIPLIQAVRNPGLRDRHWEQLFQDTGLFL